MALITLEEFKTYLQIPTLTTTYDAGYAAFIDAISADVEAIANQYFDLSYTVVTVIGSEYLTSSVALYDVFVGSSVSGTGIPDRAKLQTANLYQLNMNKYATASGSITALFNAVPEQIKPVIANMVIYKILNNTSSSGGEVNDLKSKGIGPISLSFGDGAAIDKNYEYPRTLVKSIERIKRLSFDKGELRTPGMDITNRLYRRGKKW